MKITRIQLKRLIIEAFVDRDFPSMSDKRSRQQMRADAEVEIPDVLSGEPMTSTSIAQALGSPEPDYPSSLVIDTEREFESDSVKEMAEWIATRGDHDPQTAKIILELFEKLISQGSLSADRLLNVPLSSQIDYINFMELYADLHISPVMTKDVDFKIIKKNLADGRKRKITIKMLNPFYRLD